MNSSIFKAYDVRGIYPEEINKEDAFRIGVATVKFLKAKTLVVGEDCRLASPTLRGAVIDAITKAGANVKYIGQSTTPLFYFSVNKLKADGGIMVTASHNPSRYGGLKIVGFESSPVGSETGLKEIEKLADEDWDIAQELGQVEETNLTSDYIDFVIKGSGINPKKNKLKIIIDAGNGMASIVVKPLMEKLGFDYKSLCFEIDCSFPNHSPDISKQESLKELQRKVTETKVDLGVAFDGDGDRVVFVDQRGEIIRADLILALLFKARSNLFSKPKTVYDLRISRSVKELLGSKGIKSRTGHSFIKQAMKANNADLGGELSGHFFLKEMKHAESSVWIMLEVMKLISEKNKSLFELIRPFQKYYHSGEINTEIGSREQGLKILGELKIIYSNGNIDETDGITVEYPDWWFNLRLSNTEPIVRLVVEGNTKELMNDKVRELGAVVR